VLVTQVRPGEANCQAGLVADTRDSCQQPPNRDRLRAQRPQITTVSAGIPGTFGAGTVDLFHDVSNSCTQLDGLGILNVPIDGFVLCGFSGAHPFDNYFECLSGSHGRISC
jgi:hypothetical protein